MINIIELQKVIIEEFKKGSSCKRISEVLKLNVNVVSFLLKAADVDVKYVPKIQKIKLPLPLKEMKKLYVEENWSIEDLEIEFNVSRHTVYNRLKEMGVVFRGRVLKSANFDLEQIKKWYLDDRMTSLEIGNKLGVSYMTVLKYLKQNNIQVRDPHYVGKKYKKRK